MAIDYSIFLNEKNKFNFDDYLKNINPITNSLSDYLDGFDYSKADLVTKNVDDKIVTIAVTNYDEVKKEFVIREFAEKVIFVNAYDSKSGENLGASEINFKELNPDSGVVSARGYISAQKTNSAEILLSETIKSLDKYSSKNNLIIKHLVAFSSPYARTALKQRYMNLGYCSSDTNFELEKVFK